MARSFPVSKPTWLAGLKRGKKYAAKRTVEIAVEDSEPAALADLKSRRHRGRARHAVHTGWPFARTAGQRTGADQPSIPSLLGSLVVYGYLRRKNKLLLDGVMVTLFVPLLILMGELFVTQLPTVRLEFCRRV